MLPRPTPQTKFSTSMAKVVNFVIMQLYLGYTIFAFLYPNHLTHQMPVKFFDSLSWAPVYIRFGKCTLNIQCLHFVWYQNLAQIHVSFLTKSAGKKVFVPDKEVKMVVKSCYAAAAHISMSQHCTRPTLLFAVYLTLTSSLQICLSDELIKVSVSLSEEKSGLEQIRPGLRPATSPPQATSALLQPLTNNTESPAAAAAPSWPVGNRAARPVRGCYLHYRGESNHTKLW